MLTELLSVTDVQVARAALALLRGAVPWGQTRDALAVLDERTGGVATGIRDGRMHGRSAAGTDAAARGAALAGAAGRRAATIFRREEQRSDEADPDHPAVERALALIGQGEPLPDGLRREMEGRFGVDFRHVRIHTDDVAQQAALAVAARAFTVGEDIFFGPWS